MKKTKTVMKKTKTVMKKTKTVMVTGDYHIPYTDKKAYQTMLSYAKKIKPDTFIINGDFIDAYTLSHFDRNPERKTTFAQEINEAKKVLQQIRKTLPRTRIIYLDANHEKRLTKYLWNHNELFDLGVLSIEKLLELDKHNIEFVKADLDYWKTNNGVLQIKNTLIMHGDNKLNGATTSQYSGYSAKNTVQTTMSNTCLNHVHRLAKVYVRDLVGLECGCLCMKSKNFNWQQGFVTFSHDNKDCFNFRTHEIKNGKLLDY